MDKTTIQHKITKLCHLDNIVNWVYEELRNSKLEVIDEIYSVATHKNTVKGKFITSINICDIPVVLDKLAELQIKYSQEGNDEEMIDDKVEGGD